MAYKVSTWAKVKTDYESGNYSFEELHRKYTISEKQLKTKAQKDKWIKGKLKPEIEAKIQETMKEKFTRLGLTEDKVLKKVKEVIDDSPKAGLEFYFKLVGSYAPAKREITGKDGSALLPTSKMTKEELLKQLEEL